MIPARAPGAITGAVAAINADDRGDDDPMAKRGSTPAPSRGEISEWVDKAIAHAGMIQADLSRALVQAGLTSCDRAAVSKVIKGQRSLRAEEMLATSRITGYPISDPRVGAPKLAENVDIRPARDPAAETKGSGRSVDRRLAQATELLDTLRQIEALERKLGLDATGARRKRKASK